VRNGEANEVWKLTHAERAAMVDTLEELKPCQWNEPSLCAGWSVQAMIACFEFYKTLGYPLGVRQLSGAGLATLGSRTGGH
jgi:hypothetical protein